jgi:hypothetical protein
VVTTANRERGYNKANEGEKLFLRKKKKIARSEILDGRTRKGKNHAREREDQLFQVIF